MRLPVALAAAICSVWVAESSAQQALVCPPQTSSSAAACEVFHYHLQAYRPDTRQFVELIAVNQFASQSACERAREAQIKRNLAVVDFFKRVRNQQQYEPDRVGPCHCDMTIEKSSAVFMNDSQRMLQVRSGEEVRLRVRERLLDSELTSDNELVRNLIVPPATLPALGGPKLVPLPSAAATPTVTNPVEDLQGTRAVDTAAPAVASLDLPLVEPMGGGQVLPPAAAPVAPETVTAPAPVRSEATQPQPAIAQASTESSAQPPAAVEGETSSAADAADAFIEYETQRIQNVLKASSAISDETVKSKIFEACMQRIQLLSNLRSLIEGSGSRSRLAAAAQAARSEAQRMDFVSRLFGDAVAAAWAPKDATDVILPPDAGDSEPERVLRDSSGRYPAPQKKRALYLLLARSQPTEDQQLWLVTIIDGFLR